VTGGALPVEFQGLWRRWSVSVGADTVAEPALVLWWQAARAFMDIRWRFDAPTGHADGLSEDRVMAGYTTYEPVSADGGFLTWHHDVDSLAGAGADRSAVHWDGDDLVEVGAVPVDADGPPVTFTEVWHRVGPELPEIGDRVSSGWRVMTARAERWRLELTIPSDPVESAALQLQCRNSARWSLEATFPPASMAASG
jgi:hypothetical protein